MKCIYLNMYKKNVGMIGLGSWGKNIYRNLEILNVLEKIYDNNTEHLNNIVTSKKKIANNADEIILSKDIDSIIIASPADTHKNYIIKSLLNNKNVFVEKPLCLSLKDAMEIKRLSSEVNKIVFVGHLLHYHNGFNQLKNIIKLGKIGNLQIIKANRLNFGTIRQKESVLFDLASHDISTSYFLLNTNPKRPKELVSKDLPVSRDGGAKTPADLLALEGVRLVDCKRLWPELEDIDSKLHSQLETDCRYSGYLARQQADIEAMRRDDALRIPPQTSFLAIGGLSAESCDLLERHQPETIGQASRIPGMTPAALVAVLRYLKKERTVTSSQAEDVQATGQQSIY